MRNSPERYSRFQVYSVVAKVCKPDPLQDSKCLKGVTNTEVQRQWFCTSWCEGRKGGYVDSRFIFHDLLQRHSKNMENVKFLNVKQIEKRDSVLTSKQQIDRLLRPGSSYFNLNPFEVLQIDPEATDDELKKRFRALSILVHPDKNQDDPERAQKAFEVVDKAYKLLLEPEQKKRAVDVIQAGKEYVEHMVKQKKKQLKKDGKSQDVEEDDPEVFKQAVYKQTMKLFAELEIKRKEREAKDMHERKRAREEEIEAAEKAKRDREWQKNFEESRDGRVDSWRTFQSKGKTKEKKSRSFLKPPKVKMEQRE
ncbi:dnaJ homolog subfamily C member 8 isoform X1 [Austrofundulus limnaeus]|uniref:DnaJ homolog subfamily C member 8 n=1 Tax=Austrofundulus limnaeus TaxID=52670 RepID=A0A2I4BLI6_AUSLI|nr:PREDICTED: dnaJ homolog subfamily C member 8 isoform X1 [Austrofundulus limnaeus]